MALNVPLPGNAVLASREYLLTVPEVTAIVGTRIGTEINTTRPCLRIRQITSSEYVRGRLQGALLQFDAYADTIGTARLLIDTTYAAMLGLEGSTARGVVTGVTHERGPDQTADPVLTNSQGDPLPDWQMDLRVFVHP